MEKIVNNLKHQINEINELSLKVSQYENILLFFYELKLEENKNLVQIKLFNNILDDPNSLLLDEITISLNNDNMIAWLNQILSLIYQKNLYKLNFINKSIQFNGKLFTLEIDTNTYLLTKSGKKYFNTQENYNVISYCNWNIFSFLAAFYHNYYQDFLPNLNIVNDNGVIINKISDLVKEAQEREHNLRLIDWFLFFDVALEKNQDQIKIIYKINSNKEILMTETFTCHPSNTNELKTGANLANYLYHVNDTILLLVRRLILDVNNEFLKYNNRLETWTLSILGSALVEHISYQDTIIKLITERIKIIRKDQN